MGMRCSSSCSKRRAPPGGMGWRGKAHPRPKTMPSMGPSHTWVLGEGREWNRREENGMRMEDRGLRFI